MPHYIPFAIQGYILEKSIGEGNAGTVYRAHPQTTPAKSSHSAQYAVKIVPRSKVREPVRREVDILMRLRHPNIIRLHRVMRATQATQSTSSHSSSLQRHHSYHVPSPSLTSLALVMEHASAGDMFTEVSSAGSLHPRVVRRRLRDITAALQYLHNNRYVHLDVKLENIVITNSMSAKLIDFGCAREMDKRSDSSNNSTMGGTLHYLPPEVLESCKTIGAPSSDAWSLGVLAYTALVGYYPFSATASDTGDSEEATRHRILNCPPHNIPSSVRLPTDLHRIVFGLLEKDPRKRMTIEEVVSELERSSEISRPRALTHTQLRPARHTLCECPSRRPRSPAGAADADFAACTCDDQQSIEDALKVVDSIQRNRISAARDVHRYLSDLDRASGSARRHSSSRNAGDDRSVRSKPTISRR